MLLERIGMFLFIYLFFIFGALLETGTIANVSVVLLEQIKLQEACH